MITSILFLSLCIFYTLEVTTAAPVDPVIFLHKYGYLNPQRSSGKSLTSAIKIFQVYAHITPTGKLDSATRNQMKKPRCGVKDVGLALGSTWQKYNLLYKIGSFPTTLSQSEVKRIIKEAFGIWSQSVPLSFTEVAPSQTSDISVQFLRRSHGDEFPFDGPTGVLGHAFFPSDGRIHFDAEENFTDGRNAGTNLLWLAVHEIGHAIGLSHSQQYGSLMSPYFRPNHRLRGLPQIDQAEVRVAYGIRPTPPATCVDKMPGVCPGFKEAGQCDTYKTNAQYWCEKSCGVCR